MVTGSVEETIWGVVRPGDEPMSLKSLCKAVSRILVSYQLGQVSKHNTVLVLACSL